jgi:hypothetical protein
LLWSFVYLAARNLAALSRSLPRIAWAGFPASNARSARVGLGCRASPTKHREFMAQHEDLDSPSSDAAEPAARRARTGQARDAAALAGTASWSRSPLDVYAPRSRAAATLESSLRERIVRLAEENPNP